MNRRSFITEPLAPRIYPLAIGDRVKYNDRGLSFSKKQKHGEIVDMELNRGEASYYLVKWDGWQSAHDVRKDHVTRE